MPSTFTHVAIPAACFTVSFLTRLNKAELWKCLAVGVFLANSPDLDIIPAVVYPEFWEEIHRNWGHNVFSLFFWIWMGSRAFSLISSKFQGKQSWICSTVFVLSHVLLDAMGPLGTIRGVPLLWPFSDWKFILPFHIFDAYALNKAHTSPLLAHIFSRDFWTKAVFSEILASLIIIAVWTLGHLSLILIHTRLGQLKDPPSP